jgi:hypothetical protein
VTEVAKLCSEERVEEFGVERLRRVFTLFGRGKKKECQKNG